MTSKNPDVELRETELRRQVKKVKTSQREDTEESQRRLWATRHGRNH